MTDTADTADAQAVSADTIPPDPQLQAPDTKPAPARAVGRKAAQKAASAPVVDVEVAVQVEEEGPICEICLPRGWPDGAIAVGCEHGHWTR